MKKEFVKPEIALIELDEMICADSTCPTDCLAYAGGGGGTPGGMD